MSDLLSFNPRRLTLADLKRARAGPLDGRNPMELFSDPLERAQLVAWCLRTRDDPEFTWADAEQVITLGDFEEFADDDEEEVERPADPPVASPGEPSARPPSDEPPSSTPKPRKRTPSGASASSSASPDQSTTP